MAERVVGTGSFGVVFQVWTIGFFFLFPPFCYYILTFLSSLHLFVILMVVYNIAPLQAKCLETGEAVAIKKVLQDKRYKNRELQVMHLLDHPNVVQLKHYFFSTTDKNEVYLNLVLEYVPETVHRVIKYYNRMNQHMPLLSVQLYTYQVNCDPSNKIFSSNHYRKSFLVKLALLQSFP